MSKGAQTAIRLISWIQKQGAWRRIFVFLLILGLVWIPIAGPLYILGYSGGWSSGAEIVALVLLYSGFLWGLPRWGKAVHCWQRPFARCGLVFQTQTGRDWLAALTIGVLGVFALFGFETLMGWATPTAPSPKFVRFLIEGLLMAVAVGFAEEMLFRGWVLAELEETYSSKAALVMNGLFFAATHFIKPFSEIVRTFPQFLGLVVLGMALVWARRTATAQSGERDGGTGRSQTRLGYPMGLHTGLIWGYYIVNVGGLSEYTGRVPTWVTGVDNNPLAGLLGLILLGLIAAQFARVAQPKTLL